MGATTKWGNALMTDTRREQGTGSITGTPEVRRLPCLLKTYQLDDQARHAGSFANPSPVSRSLPHRGDHAHSAAENCRTDRAAATA